MAAHEAASELGWDEAPHDVYSGFLGGWWACWRWLHPKAESPHDPPPRQGGIRLVLSCGCERIVDRMVLDADDIKDGDTGWCPEHEEAEVEAMFVEDGS